MKNILFTEPIALQRIWGGTDLANQFNIPFEGSLPGEIIAAAGFGDHDTLLRGQRQTLSQFYAKNKDYFGLTHHQFPLAINFIDARKKLSIQVHPTEEYARENEGCCGLPEAWVVLNARDNAELIAGHKAQTKSEFEQLARMNAWDRLLTVHPVMKGDCFILPPGTVHAVGEGVQVYEVTHAADMVYRLYDYDRPNHSTGKPRVLNLDKALDVIYTPQVINKSQGSVLQSNQHVLIEELIDIPKVFTIRKIETLNSSFTYTQEHFGIYTIIEGRGTVNEYPIKQGDTFIAPCGNFGLNFQGKFTCYMATYREGYFFQ